MKKLITVFLVLILGMFLFAGANSDSSAADSGEKEIGDYKIVLILPGQVNDQGWNASNYAGVVTCNTELGTNMEFVENVQPADFESTFREYGERG